MVLALLQRARARSKEKVMAQFDLNRAGDTPISTLKLNEIAPLNWRRYPGKVMTPAMVTPTYVPVITYNGGVANQGAAAGNDGEVGTINSSDPSRGQGWNTQAEKAAVIGTTMAVDVTKSYQGTRGAISKTEPYPSADTSQVPAAFLESNYIAPGADG
jgi:hypothetical protein